MTAALTPMTAAGTIVRIVKKSRNGSRRPPRSLRAPRGGDTSALMPTETTMQIVWTSWPRSWPKFWRLRQPQADRGRHHRVAEDRVGEVVDGPAALGDLPLVARIGWDGLGLGLRIGWDGLGLGLRSGGGLHCRIIGTRWMLSRPGTRVGPSGRGGLRSAADER